MAENQEKLDELLAKIKSLSGKVKTTRAQFGSPLVDRVLERVGRISEKLPQHDGGSNPRQQPQQPQESALVCPKCGVLALQGSHFCSSCGFDFEAEQRRQVKEGFEREKLERAARVGVLF